MAAEGNIFAGLTARLGDEEITALVAAANVRIERIVSHGEASPPGFWYDQDWAEFVLVLQGAAGLRFADEAAARSLRPGDYLHIPAHVCHRVDWTDPAQATVWLAVHHR
jgi:cupin 2 domain-containing protein